MRAMVWGEGGALAPASVPKPAPGPGEVRVRVRACGICGSDLHLRSAGFVQRGVAPGHEFAGVVDAVGSGVLGLAPGTAVAVEPLRSCGRCDECRRGLEAICAEGQLLGVHASGGFAEYAVVAARRAFPVPAELDPRVAALAEPMAVVVRGHRRGGLARQRVLVLGAGTLGLLGTLAARALGAGEVHVSARHAAQAQLAKDFGAARVLDEAEAAPGELARAGRRPAFDLVLETVGGADTLNAATAAVRRGGTVAVLGMFWPRSASTRCRSS
jgi:threonine dehydrogenase-like Zn-dependent dehydrogenase